MTHRRKFIKYSIFGAAALGLGYTGFKVFTPYQNSIAAILKEDLKGLKVNEDDIIKFSEQASKENVWGLDDNQQKVMGLYDSGLFKRMPLPYQEKYRFWRDQIVGTFLLSTDFFINKMDESKPIVYSGRIWGPYRSSCMNPFSAIYYTLDS